MSVVIIYSNWTILKIFNFFTDYLEADKLDIGMYKIIRQKDKHGNYQDTNKTLFLIKNSLFIKCLEEGLDMQQPDLDFRVTNFNLHEIHHYPKSGYFSDLFVKIPTSLSSNDCEILINEKMNVFVNFDMITKKEYKIRTPLKSRISGEHKGYMLLDFMDVEVDTIAYIKLLLHDSFFYLDENKNIYNIFVYWRKQY